MKIIKSIFLFMLFLNCISIIGSEAKKPKYGFVRMPLRGNAFDIHFINLTPEKFEAKPHYSYNAVDGSLNNLFFIPNYSNDKYENYPLDVRLNPIQALEDGETGKMIARKFIQGVVVYNNPLSYKKLLYNSESDFASYSSFMWSNGTRTQKNGDNSFKNAVEELKNFYYDVSIPVKGGSETLSFKLRLFAESNLNLTSEEFTSAPGYVQDFNNIAAILTIVGGLLSIPTNPAGGIVGTLSGIAWTISGTGWMIDTDFNYTQLNLYNKGLSWLSSPFDLIAYPEDCVVKNDKGEVIAKPEYDRERCTITYFLGTNSNPQSVIIQIAASIKGDLYIYAISKNILKRAGNTELLTKNKTYLKKSKNDVVKQKR